MSEILYKVFIKNTKQVITTFSPSNIYKLPACVTITDYTKLDNPIIRKQENITYLTNICTKQKPKHIYENKSSKYTRTSLPEEAKQKHQMIKFGYFHWLYFDGK
jgi:hypothetical protein